MESKKPEDKNNETEKKEEVNKELNELIKKNEDLLNFQKKCEEEISTLQKENENKKLKIESKTNSELFDIIIDELKDYLKSQNRTNEIMEEKQKLQDEINNAYYKAQQASSNYDQLESFNSDIIKKIKEINEEKNKIEERLKENYNETKTQCDKFKEEYKKKFDEVSNEALMKENIEIIDGSAKEDINVTEAFTKFVDQMLDKGLGKVKKKIGEEEEDKNIKLTDKIKAPNQKGGCCGKKG